MRPALPQLGGDFFLTDGGIETTLVFHDGLELPDLAAFDLLKGPEGERALKAPHDTLPRHAPERVRACRGPEGA